MMEESDEHSGFQDNVLRGGEEEYPAPLEIETTPKTRS